VRPADRDEILTVSQVVSRAAAICDPGQGDPAVTAVLRSFEDDERPATAPEDLEGELRGTVEGIDPEADSPAAALVAASASWLATNPGDADDPERVLRESSRLFFGEDPPPAVAGWLAEHGAG
jgi:hypothetical protein